MGTDGNSDVGKGSGGGGGPIGLDLSFLETSLPSLPPGSPRGGGGEAAVD